MQNTSVDLTIRDLAEEQKSATKGSDSVSCRKFLWRDFIHMLPESVSYFKMIVSKETFIQFLRQQIKAQTNQSMFYRYSDDFEQYIESGSIMLMDSYRKLDKNKDYYVFVLLSDNSKPVNTNIVLTIPPNGLTDSGINPSNITCEF